MANFFGTPGDDTLIGTNNDDALFGLDGNDTLDGRFGFDRIDGGNGNDTTTYAFFSGSINANLETGVVSFPGNSDRTDTLVSIENIIGAQGNDVIVGNSLNNVISGGDGDDSLFGGAGDDVLDGGFGFDRIDGGEGNDTTTYDFFSGSINANLETGVVSFPGNSDRTDTLVSIENIIGAQGNDVIVGNSLNNVISGGNGDDSLFGGAGDDVLDGGFGFDRIDGGEGNDTTTYDFFSGSINANLETGVVSFPGNSDRTDTLVSIENIVGAQGNDVIVGNSLNNVISGGNGNDTLSGGFGDDSLFGGAGDDVLDGGFGFDRIDGGEGNDTTTYDFFSGSINANLETGVVSFPGNSDLTDTLVSIENVIGSRGNDTLIGNEQDNILDGNLGDDILNGNLGNDILRGGADNDLYIVQDAGDQVIENANEGVDVIVSSVSYALPANVEHLALSGSASINATGNELNNILVGNSGVNTLTGNAGDDILVGLRGADVLSGGAGADKFGFTAPTDGVDRIQDFSRREGDQIVLLTDGFPGLRTGTLRASQFVLGNRAKDRNDRLIYNRRNGGLFYDADGRGGAGQVRIATLGNRAALRASDILAVSTNDLSLPFSLGVGSGLPSPVSPV